MTNQNIMKKLCFFCTLAYLLFSISSSAHYTKLLNFKGSTNGNFTFGSLISGGTFLYGMNQPNISFINNYNGSL